MAAVPPAGGVLVRAGRPESGLAGWTPMGRRRYLCESANERTVKQTLDLDVMSSTPGAVALQVYLGDIGRRRLVRNAGGTTDTALPGAETQYLVGGARLVWRTPTLSPSTGIDRDHRLTLGLSDLIRSTSATLGLLTGELAETSTPTSSPNALDSDGRSDAGNVGRRRADD